MELSIMLRTLTVASALAFAAFAVPAMAQSGSTDDGGSDKVNQVIVYGDDPCPASTGDEITVCARKPEGERYRIPEPLRGIDQPTSEAWSNKVTAYETVGRFGTDSCSPVGAGGFTGCSQQMLQRARAERANGTDVKFGELIQKEREKRLSTIDATAAEEQVSVEAEERAYEARQKAAADAAAKGTAAP
jgi:hypothetical protein